MNTENGIVKFLTSSWLVPVVVLLVLVLVAAKVYNFSVTDYIADRVIQKLNANYVPYGPNGNPVAPRPIVNQQQPLPPQNVVPPQHQPLPNPWPKN